MIRWILLMLLLLPGCTWLNATTTVTMPNNDIYTVSSRRNAVVEFQDGDKRIVVDNRGKLSGFELVFPALLQKTPDITLEDN